eukprot:TRINITY_DN45016_c0_g1_i1.p1 TRINITY_DN45016_c0_g1~~TRINITY_DN45016_c0_g1_i1.p1  ORF type:complete len:787 (+),score=155.05 TRINITY_DN45016_c0_g1_i1:89-2449(+)
MCIRDSPTGDLSRAVSPSGDDSAAGTASRPWKTLQRALRFLESERPRGAHAVITLSPGVYRLNGTLVLDQRHSDAAFVAANGSSGATVISGGVALDSTNEVTWARNQTSGAWVATVPRSLGFDEAGISAVSASGVVQHVARWPNGDPTTYCARDLHGGNCPGYAQVSDHVTKGTSDGITPVGPTNVVIRSKQSGNVIFTGTMAPFGDQHEFNVTSPSEPWEHQKPTRSQFQANTGGSLDRFDNTTYAYYNATLPETAIMNRDFYLRASHWSNPEEGVVHMYQSGYWGNWGLQIQSVDLSNSEKPVVHWGLGGFQESRGGTMGGLGSRGLRQDYFVEGLYEELDSEAEFYYDKSASKLHLMWSGTTPPGEGEVVAVSSTTLVSMTGSSKAMPVHDVQWTGVTFRDAAPTFMAPHESTSGGDWAMHRGAAVVIESAERVTLQRCSFEGVHGNGVIMSKYVRGSVVTDSSFVGIGETPVVLVGAAQLMDGRAGTHPINNQITNNYLHNFGVVNRQAAGVFEGVACANNISFNVIHDGPRAGINMNDGYCGGSEVRGNLLFNVVLDTGEHGATNSWDRQPMLWVDEATGEVQAIPSTRHVVGNFVFRVSFRGQTSNLWGLDKDDGSSNYYEADNVIVFGSIKDRDGVDRAAVGNLVLYPDGGLFEGTSNEPAMVLQVSGFETDSFTNNTVVLDSAKGGFYSCSAAVTPTVAVVSNGGPHFADNVFLVPNSSTSEASPFSQKGCTKKAGKKPVSFKQWQQRGFDQGSTYSAAPLTTAQLVAMARAKLPLLQ